MCIRRVSALNHNAETSLIGCTFVRLLKKFVLQKYGLKTFFGI
ncbi:hypothetical protein HMPREF9554_01122 [Treponema phagedenis F0421]|nr:hypothetical protein HMPREF9554_01122 [Treponema phagedenis F0421]